MSLFIVKTHEYRNLVIEADSFEHRLPERLYVFASVGRIVASVPERDVFAVIADDNEVTDFVFRDDLNEDSNCEAQDLLERATDILAAENVNTDSDPTFVDDYSYFVGETPEETHE